MSIVSAAYRRFGPVMIMAGLFLISVLFGCRRGYDPRLAEADALMEERPDSVLKFLSAYSPAPGASGDSAYHALLLTHARYKNFIDETGDILITVAVDWFLDHDDDEKTSRALFLQGMVRMNAGRFGEAAVSFSRGLDMARECGNFMWEGQCAYGLYILYGLLHDGSAQVDYAKQAYAAFQATEDKDWITYSKMELARAYHNNLKDEDAIEIMDGILNDEDAVLDSLRRAELSQLRALSLFALGDYGSAMQSYADACRLDASVITDDDRYNMKLACHALENDSVSHGFNRYWESYQIEDSSDVFDILGRQGDYKAAYEALIRYKNDQDSVLSVIFSNNVSESVNEYLGVRRALNESRMLNERKSLWIVILALSVFCIFIVLIYRERQNGQDALLLKMEADMESLRSDLRLQYDRTDASQAFGSAASRREIVEDFKKIIRQRYAEANRSCDEYYQQRGRPGNKKDIMDEQINGILNDLRTNIDKTVEYVDETSGGLYSSFKKDFFTLSHDYQLLYLYVMLGFNARTISVLLDRSVDGVYNMKSRLKTKIESSGVSEKMEYLKFF